MYLFSKEAFKKCCFSDHGLTMVRVALCGKHKQILLSNGWLLHGLPGNLEPAMVLGWSPYGQAVSLLIVSSWSLGSLTGNLPPAVVLGWSPYGQAALFLVVSSWS